ncbi:dynamin family protein [Leptothrix ochracea]|uniref:dynamin family protein n=1 Tax=Leptothrix ochracea TaxID=735331 RepID=UPI0034E19B9D
MSLDFQFSDEELAALEAETANPYLADPVKGLQLITRLIAQPETPIPSKQRGHFQHLHDLIHQSYVSLSSRDTCPTEAANFRDLIALEDTLEDLVTFPALANKTVIGIGGGFSAGKSRFINTLLGNDILPEALEPTTAIPSYMIAGSQESIEALNQFDHAVELDRSALQAITHAFPRHYLHTHGVEVGFAHIVRLLMVHSPNFSWKNLAFLDTPGYSKPDLQQSVQADRQIAMRQLREADQIIWLLNAKNGSIRRDDIEFLRDLNHPKPIFFVITQADLVGRSRISAILNTTAAALEEAQIYYAGLMAWAAPLGNNFGNKWDGDDIHEWLTWINGSIKETQSRVECARILDSHIQYNSKALAENKELLGTLNELIPLATGEEKKTTLTNRQISLNMANRSIELITELKGPKKQKTKNKKGLLGDFPFEILFETEEQKEHQIATNKSIEEILYTLKNLYTSINTIDTTTEVQQAETLRRHIKSLREQQRHLKELIADFGSLKEDMLTTITQLVGDIVDDTNVQHGPTLIQFMKINWFKREPVHGEIFDVRVVAVKVEEKKVVVVFGDDLASTGIGFNRIWAGLRMEPQILVKGSMLQAVVQAIENDSVTLAIRNPYSEH